MKKSLLSVGAGAMALAMFATGCVSSDTSGQYDKLQELVKNSRKYERIELTENPVVDPLIGASTSVYFVIGGEVRETVESNFGQMYVMEVCKNLTDTNYSTQMENVRQGDKKSEQEMFSIFEKEIYPTLNGLKDGLTPALVFDESLDKLALARKKEYDGIKKSNGDLKSFDKEDAWLKRGAKVAKETVGKIDWERKKVRMEKLKADLAKLQASIPVSIQKLTERLTGLTEEAAKLAQKPEMVSYLKEIAVLNGKKTFASQEAKQAIDAEIAALATKDQFKDVVALDDKLNAEIIKLKNDLATLKDKVEKQVMYTAEMIPWVAESNKALREAAGEDEKNESEIE